MMNVDKMQDSEYDKYPRWHADWAPSKCALCGNSPPDIVWANNSICMECEIALIKLSPLMVFFLVSVVFAVCAHFVGG